MRIQTTTVDDFLANCESGTVWEGRIYYERTSRPLNGKTKQDATSFDVFYQLSCVLAIEDGQALLSCGVACGVDRTTGDGDLGGTEEQAKIHGRVVEWCGSRRVVLLPGVLDQ